MGSHRHFDCLPIPLITCDRDDATMRFGPLFAFVLVVSAGCAEPGTGPVAPEDPHAASLGSFTGAVLGVAVDEAVAPLAGATITVAGKESVTGEDGRFGFAGVPPGEHWVVGKAPDLLGQRVLVNVVVGEGPAWAVLAFQAIPVNVVPAVPRYEMFHAEGHIDVSSLTCVGGVQLLAGGDTVRIASIEEPFKTIQAEFIWEPASDLAALLEAGVQADDGERPWPWSLARETGATPLVVRADYDDRVGPSFELQAAVRAGCEVAKPVSPGVMALQDYEAFVHVFYNVRPASGWSYVRDGPPQF